MGRSRSKQAGFTLIETMVGVALAGGLAAVAIPTFADKPKKAQELEAQVELERIAKQAKTVFLADGAFPQGTATTLPGNDGAACGQASKKFAPTTAWTNDIVWGTLDFAITQPTKYSFHYESIDTNTAVITAVADLNCDGRLTTLTMKIVGIDGDIKTAIDQTSNQIADQVAANDATQKVADDARAAEALARHNEEERLEAEKKGAADGVSGNSPYVAAPYTGPTSTTTR